MMAFEKYHNTENNQVIKINTPDKKLVQEIAQVHCIKFDANSCKFLYKLVRNRAAFCFKQETCTQKKLAQESMIDVQDA